MMIKGLPEASMRIDRVITVSREGQPVCAECFFWRYMWNDASFNPVDIQRTRRLSLPMF